MNIMQFYFSEIVYNLLQINETTCTTKIHFGDVLARVGSLPIQRSHLGSMSACIAVTNTSNTREYSMAVGNPTSS